MAGIRDRGRLVRRYILENVGSNSQHIARSTAFQFGISRQAVNKHLSRLVKEGLLTARGMTRNRTYTLTIPGKKRAKPETDSRRERAEAARLHNPR